MLSNVESLTHTQKRNQQKRRAKERMASLNSQAVVYDIIRGNEGSIRGPSQRKLVASVGVIKSSSSSLDDSKHDSLYKREENIQKSSLALFREWRSGREQARKLKANKKHSSFAAGRAVRILARRERRRMGTVSTISAIGRTDVNSNGKEKSHQNIFTPGAHGTKIEIPSEKVTSTTKSKKLGKRGRRKLVISNRALGENIGNSLIRSVRAHHVARVVRNANHFIALLSDVALYARGWYIMWWESGVRVLYVEISQCCDANPAYAGAAFVQCLLHLHGLQYSEANVLRVLGRNQPLLDLLMEVGFSENEVLRCWREWEGTHEYQATQRAISSLGSQAIYAPLLYLLKRTMVNHAWAGLDVAVSILARFCPPLDVALSVVDVVFAGWGIVQTLVSRRRMHASLVALTEENTVDWSRPSTLIRSRRVRLPPAPRDGMLAPAAPIESEEIRLGRLNLNALGRAATGAGLVVAIPIGVAGALASAGVIGGLTIASSPFLAGYEAYNRVRGTRGIDWSSIGVRLRSALTHDEPQVVSLTLIPGRITEVAVGTTEMNQARYLIMQPAADSSDSDEEFDHGEVGTYTGGRYVVNRPRSGHRDSDDFYYNPDFP